MLNEINYKYYTYIPKTEKLISLLLKGLNSSYEEIEILKELECLGITNVNFTKVIRFSTNKSKREGRLLPIYIIQLSPQSEINNLKKGKIYSIKLFNGKK